MIETFIENYWNLYHLMIALSLVIGLIAGYIHETGIPILWTVILSGIMFFGHDYLNPMITGLFNFDKLNITILSVLLLISSIIWISIMILSHSNLLRYGEVVQ